jgi:membrane protein
MASESMRTKTPSSSPLLGLRNTLWRLVTATVGSCFRHRVTGLAAEAAFFAVLSLPPLVFGLAGSVGYIVNRVDPEQIDSLQASVIDLAGKVLTQTSVHEIVEPTLRQVLNGSRFDVISIGFVL